MRDNAVTYSKALAIMMMVWGHACYSTYVPVWVNMFDIPSFYFLSGYCFKEKYLTDFKTFVFKKTKGLYWPYVKWMFVFLLLHNIFYNLGVYNSQYGFEGKCSVPYETVDILRGIKNVFLKLSGNERLLGGYWFLPCMFVGSFISFFVIRATKAIGHKVFLFFCVIIILIISVLCNKYEIRKWIVNYKVIEASFFILSGYFYKITKCGLHSSCFFLLISFVLVTIGTVLWPGSAFQVPWSHQIMFMITAVCGSISLLGICKQLEVLDVFYLKKIMSFIGSNTLTILTWHFCMFVFVSYIITMTYDLSILRIGECPVIICYSDKGWWIVYFLVGIVCPLFLAYCNKYIKNDWLKL